MGICTEIDNFWHIFSPILIYENENMCKIVLAFERRTAFGNIIFTKTSYKSSLFYTYPHINVFYKLLCTYALYTHSGNYCALYIF